MLDERTNIDTFSRVNRVPRYNCDFTTRWSKIKWRVFRKQAFFFVMAQLQLLTILSKFIIQILYTILHTIFTENVCHGRHLLSTACPAQPHWSPVSTDDDGAVDAWWRRDASGRLRVAVVGSTVAAARRMKVVARSKQTVRFDTAPVQVPAWERW